VLPQRPGRHAAAERYLRDHLLARVVAQHQVDVAVIFLPELDQARGHLPDVPLSTAEPVVLVVGGNDDGAVRLRRWRTVVYRTVRKTRKQLASEPVLTGQRQIPHVMTACAGCAGATASVSPATVSTAASTAVVCLILF